MKCPYCGYSAPIMKKEVSYNNERWWFKCPQCGLVGRQARTMSEAQKNWEEDAVTYSPLEGGNIDDS